MTGHRTRPSAADKERVAAALHGARADERLSPDTFYARLDLAYAARTRGELDRLVDDLRPLSRARLFALATVEGLSSLLNDLRAAWRRPRTPRLTLPLEACTVVGRSNSADFVVPDPTVSARHAILTHRRGGWTLRDNRSTNGTFVNGWRIAGETIVRPGDELLIGRTRFVLAAPVG
jgi:hypothetical protein